MSVVATADRATVKAGLAASGMPWPNTVRPPKRAFRYEETAGVVRQGPLAGALLTVAIYEGQASDGYKSDFQRRRRWWLLLTVTASDGTICWRDGQRFTDEAKAWAEYRDSAKSITEGR